MSQVQSECDIIFHYGLESWKYTISIDACVVSAVCSSIDAVKD